MTDGPSYGRERVSIFQTQLLVGYRFPGIESEQSLVRRSHYTSRKLHRPLHWWNISPQCHGRASAIVHTPAGAAAAATTITTFLLPLSGRFHCYGYGCSYCRGTAADVLAFVATDMVAADDDYTAASDDTAELMAAAVLNTFTFPFMISIIVVITSVQVPVSVVHDAVAPLIWGL